MSNLKFTMSLLLATCLICGCQKNDQAFQYNVDKFYDLEILRYDVPEFDQLTAEAGSTTLS